MYTKLGKVRKRLIDLEPGSLFDIPTQNCTILATPGLELLPSTLDGTREYLCKYLGGNSFQVFYWVYLGIWDDGSGCEYPIVVGWSIENIPSGYYYLRKYVYPQVFKVTNQDTASVDFSPGTGTSNYRNYLIANYFIKKYGYGKNK